MDELRAHLVYEVMRRRKRGETVRGIARALRLDRKTVRSVLRQEETLRSTGESALKREVKTGMPRGSKLDPHVPQIEAWLDEFPNLTARRVHEMLVDLGVKTGYSIVSELVTKLRQERGKKEKKAATRVITPPGQQFQFDWSPYTIENGQVVQLFGCLLSWARGHHFEADNNTRQTTTLRFLARSFDAWGGVPHQGVTDSMPGVVDRWELDKPVLNARFVDFAAYYNFTLLVSPRRYPQFKGKVERPFWFAELSLLNGRHFYSVDQFRETLAWWLREKALSLPHPDTRRPRREMLQEERPFLQPLPRHPYDVRDVATRVVDAYGTAVYETNFYRLPDKYIGEIVYLCIDPNRIEFFDRSVNRIVEYPRLQAGAGLHSGEGSRRQRNDIGLLADIVSQWGPEAGDFVTNLRQHVRCAGAHIAHLIDLRRIWAMDDILAAIRRALEYAAFDAHSVERILTIQYKPRKLDDLIADTTRRQVKRTLEAHPVIQRSLGQYETLKWGDTPQKPKEKHHDPK